MSDHEQRIRSEFSRQAASMAQAAIFTWTNHREFSEWIKITAAPERIAPLEVVMTSLAGRGAGAGIGLRLEGGKLRFEHTAALTVAVKR